VPVVLLAVLPALAQNKPKSDAQLDGFEGSVRSASTEVVNARVNWHQPGGSALVYTIPCRECQYDPDGTRTLSGQISADGVFLGEHIKTTRDGQGHVLERTRISSTDNSVIDRQVLGPFGPTERTFPANSKIQRQTLTYDNLGYLAERLSYDAAGNLIERDHYRTNPDGQWTERSVWGANDHLQHRETYDPETDTQHFESYDDLGAPRVTFVMSHNKMASFWEASDAPNQYGNSFTAALGNGSFDQFKCHKDGTCDVSHVRYTYADQARHLPASAEWRDASGNLLYAT
jgi:hypothetical protein